MDDMNTWKRKCIKPLKIKADNGTFELKVGEEYLTSSINSDGSVTVFANFWVRVAQSHFGDKRKFT